MPKLIKIIWSYWDGPDNDLNKCCLKSWKKFLPGWDIRLLNRDSVEKYIIKKPSTYDNLTITAKSDLIRLNLLYNYGGIWLDTSILLHQNFEWIQNYVNVYSKKDYFQYKVPWQPWEENNFIITLCTHNQYIKKWLDVFLGILEYWPNVNNSPIYKQDYTRQIWERYPGKKTIFTYFMCYQAHLYLIKHDKSFKKPKILPVNGIGAILPVILPNFLEIRYFTKFVRGGRRVVKYQKFVCVILLVIFLGLIFRKFSVNKILL